mgnify:FL=1
MAQATASAKTYEESIERAEELLDETRRTGRLTHQLLSLERLNGRQAQLEVLDLNELASEIGRRNGAQVLSAGVDFSVEVETEPLVVLGDETLLTEAIQNLIDNALSHGGPFMTYISVMTRRVQNNAEIRVENDGSLIPEALKEAIFDRFTQNDQSKGAGLGLAISSEIAKLNKGRIELKTRPVTSFSMFFPQALE